MSKAPVLRRNVMGEKEFALNQLLGGLHRSHGEAMADSVATGVVEQFLTTARLMQEFRTEFLSDFGISEVRYRVMEALDGAGEQGISQAGLAEVLRQAESSVSTLVERMRQDEMLYRHRSKLDRRKRILALTEKGRDLWSQIRMQRDRQAASLLSGLSPDDQDTLSRVITRLSESLEQSGTQKPPRVGSLSRPDVRPPHFPASSVTASADPHSHTPQN